MGSNPSMPATWRQHRNVAAMQAARAQDLQDAMVLASSQDHSDDDQAAQDAFDVPPGLEPFHGKGAWPAMSPMPPGPAPVRPVAPGLVNSMVGDAKNDPSRDMPPGRVILEDLERSYTVDELKEHLPEHDFEPEEVVNLARPGGFCAFFKKVSEAKALMAALKGLQPPDKVLRKCKQPYRVHWACRVCMLSKWPG